MKSFLDEFFYTHKQKRVRESVMLARISVSVFLIVACLAAMSFTAYAYFTCTVSSGIQQIQSAYFDADISVAAPDGTLISLTPTEGNKYLAHLNADVCYTVKIKRTIDGNAETGFCVITSDRSNKVYCTQQLGIDRTAPNGSRDEMTFILTVEVSSNITFFPHWGTSTYYEKYSSTEIDGQYILQQDPYMTVNISADRIPEKNPVPPEETTAPPNQQVTTPPTTSPAPTTQPAETPSTTTPPQTESTVPPTTTPTIPETEPIETEPTETEPTETEPTETAPTQPDSTESTQPEETTTPTAVTESTDPTESN